MIWKEWGNITMGFYIRKSLRVGLFRFNASKSGVGVSTGIKGMRIGTGPRGNYVHMGRHGIYYRKTLPAVSQRSQPSAASTDTQKQPDIPVGSHEPLREIESDNISEMVDSSSKELVDEINDKLNKPRLSIPCLLVSLIVLFLLLYNQVEAWLISLSAILLFVITSLMVYRDILAKTIVVFFDIEEKFEQAFQQLHDSFETMRYCHAVWHLEAAGRVNDKKYYAGADYLVQRSKISLSLSNPPYIKTNVATPSIPVGKQTLYFFPDKVLVFESKSVGAVSYENLQVQLTTSKMVEQDTVPGDAEIVDYTWKYVNKRGGPDRRFADNEQLPIVLYDDMHFTSSTGLNEEIQLSKKGIGEEFTRAIQSLCSTS